MWSVNKVCWNLFCHIEKRNKPSCQHTRELNLCGDYSSEVLGNTQAQLSDAGTREHKQPARLCKRALCKEMAQFKGSGWGREKKGEREEDGAQRG